MLGSRKVSSLRRPRASAVFGIEEAPFINQTVVIALEKEALALSLESARLDLRILESTPEDVVVHVPLVFELLGYLSVHGSCPGETLTCRL